MALFEKESRIIEAADPIDAKGKIEKIIGLVIESTGPSDDIGTVCKIYNSKNTGYILAEIVGFKDERVLLMPYQELTGIVKGSLVESTGNLLRVPVGESLIGRVIDGFGNPIDGKGPIETSRYYPVQGTPSNPLLRPQIDERITMGIKAIDGLLTVGKGQRMGIFAGSGVGKSTLMGMISRNIEADVNVIALVGERGREVRGFIEKDLKEEGMKRSVLVVATSDQPAMMRLKCAQTATAIAEYFKDQGKDVLLMMDSLTRFAMAQREIGLATGEPPVARGYTPSLYALLPKLLERTGKFEKGSITGIYTVLVEGDDVNEPISDTVRGILDGHIVLSRNIAMRNHYPAIDVLVSISRLMNEITDPEHLQLAARVRQIMSVYYENYDLISIGAYKMGTNPRIDDAIHRIDRINAFLRQGIDEKFSFEETLDLMKELVK
ncbi:MAG TPA: flagellar protein export ATPase FliI [Bacillota bacterium]|nr:flagellar protein export ATPase FliI [Bacillota bacterium]HOK69765.1 flagellar protein export ATPase FliI [Bacillota bacterium]HPP86158.1 flagellar protein export ATPase FliI [Bacillota bacterium]